jgi:hypothetical protein
MVLAVVVRSRAQVPGMHWRSTTTLHESWRGLTGRTGSGPKSRERAPAHGPRSSSRRCNSAKKSRRPRLARWPITCRAGPSRPASVFSRAGPGCVVPGASGRSPSYEQRRRQSAADHPHSSWTGTNPLALLASPRTRTLSQKIPCCRNQASSAYCVPLREFFDQRAQLADVSLTPSRKYLRSMICCVMPRLGRASCYCSKGVSCRAFFIEDCRPFCQLWFKTGPPAA